MLNQLLLLSLLMVYEVPEGCVASENSELPEINTSGGTTVSIQSNSLQQHGCGKSMVEQRHETIVGGEPAELGAWPWIATLGFKLGSDDFFYDCGASLISARHVITAKHCVSELLSFVRLGDLNLSPDVKDGASPVDYIIAEEIMHPKSDIAILRLQKNVTFTNLIQPICLPSAPEIKDNTWAGYEPFVAGWGMTEPWKVTDHKGENKMLRQVRVPVWDNQRCKSVYNDETRGYLVDETMMCAGLADGGKDSCQGDSGGPLMVSLGKNSSYYLIGIVSWGQGCARPNVPGVYVRVSKFLDWIEKVTK